MAMVPAPDQCPDNPTNAASEPGSACACAEMSKIADANSAPLRQLAEGLKNQNAMNFAFENVECVRQGYIGLPIQSRNSPFKPIDRFNADTLVSLHGVTPHILKNLPWALAMPHDATLPLDWVSPSPKMTADNKAIAAPAMPTLTKARFISVTRQAPAAAA